MILYIDHKPAAIKQGASFEYHSDNRLFHDREDYTLNIELPLGLKENYDTFGHINRKDNDLDKIFFDAEIFADNFHKSGAVAITSITDEMVKVQFIAGRSFQNFYPEWDETYIDEIELGQMPNWKPNNYNSGQSGTINNGRTRPGNLDPDDTAEPPLYVSPADAWAANEFIALPWVNNTSGNMQNRADYVDGQFVWHATKDDDDDTEVVTQLSCQIRMYTLVQMICAAMNYSLSAEPWLTSDWIYLYSFNTIPAAWGIGQWQHTLPHWTINEFFGHLEKLMMCEFVVDHKLKTVTFQWNEQVDSSAGEVALDKIVDEFTATVTKEDESNYKPMSNIGYADAGHEMWNFYSCEWLFRKKYFAVYEYDTFQELRDAVATDTVYGSGGSVRNRGAASAQALLYAKDLDTYFVMYGVTRVKTGGTAMGEDAYATVYRLLQVNSFGDRVTDEHSDKNEEIGIVPVWLDDVPTSSEYERHADLVVFQDTGETDNTSVSGEEYSYYRCPNHTQVPLSTLLQSSLVEHIKNKDLETEQTKFNHIQVGFWFGGQDVFHGRLPRPFIDEFDVNLLRWSISHQQLVVQHEIVQSGHEVSLRLNNAAYGMGKRLRDAKKIDCLHKYEVEFISDTLPQVRAVFIIHGKRYLCAQIKTDIDEQGMSQLKKGTFFRILE